MGNNRVFRIKKVTIVQPSALRAVKNLDLIA